MTSTTPLWQRSATDLVGAIRARQVGCRELMDAVLDRVARLDQHTNAFAFVDPVAARSAADDADRALARGEAPGALHGLPISVKDLIDTRGMRTAHGSHVHAQNVPTEDAEVVARVRRAGGIVFGKTNTPEFGCKILTDSPLQGVTRNPWDLSRTPGGSSGGAAAATAMGFGPLAVTTDGAGSSRIPAACCGVFGLKPTLGALPMERAADLFGGLSCIGAMARSPADIALLYGVMAGPSGRDPWALGGRAGPAPALPARPVGLGGLRVRWLARMGNPGVDPQVLQLTTRALSRMADAGARIVDAPPSFDWALDSCRSLIRASQAARNGRFLADWRDRLDPITVQCIEEGLAQTSAEMRQAQLERSALFRRVQALFDDADVLVTPCFAAPALPASHAADAPLSVDGAPAGSLRDAWYSYAIPFNPTGHPAMSIPCGFTREGLPVGLQIVGRWHSEAGLIDIARTLESMDDGQAVWPALAGAGAGNIGERA